MSSEERNYESKKLHLVLKLGGAAITKKDAFETADVQMICLACKHLQGLYQRVGTSFVVTHGAGSFGHHTAKTYEVKSGWNAKDDKERVRIGFALTRSSVKKLNSLIVEELLRLGVPAVGLSPFESGWKCVNGRVVSDGVSSITSMIENGLIPVLHGDCVLDLSLGCTILSADTLISHISEKLDASLALFLTNVDGVFDRDPSEQGARLIERLEVDSDGGWRVPGGEDTLVQISSSKCDEDVTGGMESKLKEALSIAARGTRCLIARLGSKGGEDAINGIRVEGQCTELVNV